MARAARRAEPLKPGAGYRVMLEKVPHAVGHALKGIRPGLDKTVYHGAALAGVPATIAVSSTAFADGGMLDTRFTADGEGLSPPLAWTGVPADTAEVVIIVEDADSPTPQPLVHAIAHRLPGSDGGVAEGAMSSEPPAIALGRNSFLRIGWLPADPPAGHGVHRYVFQVFALREDAWLDEHPGRGKVTEALAALAVAKGMMVGTYQRG